MDLSAPGLRHHQPIHLLLLLGTLSPSPNAGRRPGLAFGVDLSGPSRPLSPQPRLPQLAGPKPHRVRNRPLLLLTVTTPSRRLWGRYDVAGKPDHHPEQTVVPSPLRARRR